MYIPKRYGQSKVDSCPFCGNNATVLNKQKVPVCITHKDRALDEMKCSCGSFLEMRNGKFGVFFSCMKCGNKSLKQVMEINGPAEIKQGSVATINSSPKEITVRSDDPRFFSE